MKKIIATILFLLIAGVSTAQWSPTAQVIINDVAVTSSNDSLYSGWIDITPYNAVELYVIVGDSLSLVGKFNVQYRAGLGSTEWATATPYSSDTALISNLGQATNKASGRLLRGHGATTNIIPGANFIRIFAIRNAYSVGVTSSLRVVLIGRP